MCALALALGVAGLANADPCNWPAWDSYKQALLSKEGRVIDRSTGQELTTSEAQGYGMFFALLANDRESFARMLRWTQDNLAAGDLSRHLPAWQWGKNQDGYWQVLDSNNASDADLWIAYSLLEAGRLWLQSDYSTLGRNMLRRSAAQSLRKLPGLGVMLLPGDFGFETAGAWRLNPSYLPLQLLARFGQEAPIWAELADNTRRLLLEGSPKGLAPDWLLWQAGQGWVATPGKGSGGSYNAIRVYLWLGMLAPDAPGRADLFKHFLPMIEATAQQGFPPEYVDSTTGARAGIGPVGFSASLLPMLASDPKASAALKVQRERLHQEPPQADAYYNRSLAMFGQGWDERRYRFDKQGRLMPSWVDSCKK
ncbi:MAG: cellulose synthase complex periplasmic endoglucanase BcsZ [Pseudomonas sp.]|nr:cellulose synthase complex periplasmic endoglucanase BcsZ [Pseudomonas sp.]